MPSPPSPKKIKPPPSANRDALRKKQMVSLSLNELHHTLQLWRCSSKDCRYEKVPFGPKQTGEAFVLPCGHFVCKRCEKAINLAAQSSKRNDTFTCFSNASDEKKCNTEYAYHQIGTLPKARHIEDHHAAFRPQGIRCYKCSVDRTSETQKHFRYPRELMVVCRNQECVDKESQAMSGVTLKPGEEPKTWNPRGSFYFAAVPVCMFCAATTHAVHFRDLRPITKELVFLLQRYPNDVDKGNFKEESDYEYCSPWHLSMLAKEPLKAFVKDLLVCQKCDEGYGQNLGKTGEDNRIPLILNCGHLVCTKCETEILTNSPPPDTLPKNQCGREECNFVQEKKIPYERWDRDKITTPCDVNYLFKQTFDDHMQCITERCAEIISPDHFVKLTDMKDEEVNVDVYQTGRCFKCVYENDLIDDAVEHKFYNKAVE